MQSLIPYICKLQSVFETVEMENIIDLPQIVVVGSQSTGKSSVIEGIVGRDFLPRGTGIVTRRPLLIHLIHTPLDDHQRQGLKFMLDDWATFGHLPNKNFDNFQEVCDEIQRETNKRVGTQSAISDIPIYLKIYSAKVVNLTMIDLPGITKVPVGEQPPDIEKIIHNMIMKYIQKENSIILAVTPANADFANSESLKLARKVDPNGNRTLCVLTKLDLMDDGTDAKEVLMGNVSPVKLGIIGVVGRSQADINADKTVKECLEKEVNFLNKNYPELAEKNGIPFLTTTLSEGG
uniref:Dynamin-type G domain-containing protein n=1 Tax=Panagrolaimus davidi TaxID=227884 RepID=A0A914QYU2_9BILA